MIPKDQYRRILLKQMEQNKQRRLSQKHQRLSNLTPSPSPFQPSSSLFKLHQIKRNKSNNRKSLELEPARFKTEPTEEDLGQYPKVYVKRSLRNGRSQSELEGNRFGSENEVKGKERRVRGDDRVDEGKQSGVDERERRVSGGSRGGRNLLFWENVDEETFKEGEVKKKVMRQWLTDQINQNRLKKLRVKEKEKQERPKIQQIFKFSEQKVERPRFKRKVGSTVVNQLIQQKDPQEDNKTSLRNPPKNKQSQENETQYNPQKYSNSHYRYKTQIYDSDQLPSPPSPPSPSPPSSSPNHPSFLSPSKNRKLQKQPRLKTSGNLESHYSSKIQYLIEDKISLIRRELEDQKMKHVLEMEEIKAEALRVKRDKENLESDFEKLKSFVERRLVGGKQGEVLYTEPGPQSPSRKPHRRQYSNIYSPNSPSSSKHPSNPHLEYTFQQPLPKSNFFNFNINSSILNSSNQFEIECCQTELIPISMKMKGEGFDILDSSREISKLELNSSVHPRKGRAREGEQEREGIKSILVKSQYLKG